MLAAATTAFVGRAVLGLEPVVVTLSEREKNDSLELLNQIKGESFLTVFQLKILGELARKQSKPFHG